MTTFIPFTPSEQDIADTLSSNPTEPTLQVAYKLTMSTSTTSSKGTLNFEFIPMNSDTSDGDGNFEIQVYNRCRVTLVLDPYWNWKFREEFPDPSNPTKKYPAVNLGAPVSPSNPPAVNRYWRLVRSADGMSVSFSALLLNDPSKTNLDPFNIFVDLQLTQPDGTITTVPLKVDPDIRNPGDPP